MHASYFGGKCNGKRGRGAINKVVVLGILERNELVKVGGVKDVSGASLLYLIIKAVRYDSVAYTVKFWRYET